MPESGRRGASPGHNETNPARWHEPTPITWTDPSALSASALTNDVVARPIQDTRIDTLRELYTNGDVNAALVLASEIVRTSTRPSVAETFEDVVDDDEPTDVMNVPVRSAPPVSAGPRSSRRPRVPRLLLSPAELQRLTLDQQTRLLLAHIDNVHTIEQIIELCAITVEEAITVFLKLEARGVIAIE
ncbi:MAG: hypothetical protein FWD69_03920 [Polyangiaceae bacterium]|nr:hypothetical protein [Polyangiaceae bacterium]